MAQVDSRLTSNSGLPGLPSARELSWLRRAGPDVDHKPFGNPTSSLERKRALQEDDNHRLDAVAGTDLI